MATFPKDRFDELPEDLLRRGAHRAPPKRGLGWVGLLWALIATVLLIVLGLSVLSLITNRDNPTAGDYVGAASPSASSTPTAAAKVDPKIPLTILNGTPTPQLADQVGDKLVKEGWKGAVEGVGSRLTASDRAVEKTIVFYSDAANEGAARALVASLKVGGVRLSNDYPASPITILLGADYKPGA